ncbi:Sec-independent protein translocase protein TatB [Alphaproteobacteria bacterium]|jgi:sec-independent protein translocase protein TatB|nr:Sec-independent protein translocase protein TatB [Alphaproteobacteria bacterium]|tara:strand:+ start:3352 stop:3642 length:291 start_codon:yes stop_codon:yes gene_type:complete
MLDLGWQELFIIALVALIVVGPKDLPILVRSIAKWLRSMRKILWTFQASIEEVGREAELNEIRDEAAYLLEELNEDIITDTTKINTEEKTSFGTDK